MSTRFVTHENPDIKGYEPWYGKNVTYTPIYVGGHFVCRINDAEPKDSRRSAAKYLLRLRANGYKYFGFYDPQIHGEKYDYNNVFEFLDIVERKGWTFRENVTKAKLITPDTDEQKPHWDFSGNLNEYCASFFYRIYDEETYNRVAERYESIRNRAKQTEKAEAV